VLRYKDFMGIPIGDLGSIYRNVRIAFDRRADDTPGLTRPDHEIVIGIRVAARNAMFAVVGVADGILVIDLVTTAGKEAALVHFDDVAGSLDHPFNPAIAARHAFLVIDRGDDDMLGAHRTRRFQWSNLQAHRVR